MPIEKPCVLTQDSTNIVPIRIYLEFSKKESIITIYQTVKLLSGEVILQRERRVRKPYEKHMRIGLGGVIATSRRKYKSLYKNKVTHMGIYLSHPIAFEALKKHTMCVLDRKDVKILIIEKG